MLVVCRPLVALPLLGALYAGPLGCGAGPAPVTDAAPTDGAAPNRDTAGADAPVIPPARLSFLRGDQTVSFQAEQLAATCTGGHRGVEGQKPGERFGFNVFVQQPGVYRCGEPQPFIFFWHDSPVLPATYGISGLQPGGACTVSVTSLRPRFAGSFEATLALRDGSGATTLRLSQGQFDVPFPADESCP